MKERKIVLTLAAAFLSAGLFAQAADDGFLVPLDQDLSDAKGTGVAASVASSASESKSKIAMGIWIEATSETNAIIRDIATGEKKGYEIDDNHFKSNANWWFWGDINDKFHLDAEISVWDFDKMMYKANSLGSNPPDVTWADGVQSLGEMFFSPIYNGNDDGVGSLNKVGFGIQTGYVDFLLGYGNLKGNGMSEFTGIYNVLDRWLDVGKGFTEARLGKKLKKAGDFKFDAVAGFSQMRGTYGMYDLLDVTFRDNYRGVLTFGSKTTAEDLFYYNDFDKNSVSAYFSAKPLDFLKAEVHGLGTFGQDLDLGEDTYAVAGRISYLSDILNANVMGSYAAKDVDSVWGSDGQSYDNICADTVSGSMNIEWAATKYLSVLVDEGITFNDVENLSDGLMSLRNQPIVDLELEPLLGKDILVSAYGVLNVDRQSKTASKNRDVAAYFDEAGIEVTANDPADFLKKVKFDYGMKMKYNEWNKKDGMKMNTMFNSVMLTVDFNDKYQAHLGCVARVYDEKEDTQVPFGFAAGVKINSLPLPGWPFLWAHFCYGMNPYEDNNYSLYRADDSMEKASHRTYLLKTLEGDLTKSQISFGLVWSL